MRIRCRYAKTGKLRFISAIDLGRVWERSLRRAGLPIAYTEGFSPHPKVSFPDALTLGLASTGEYAELTFAGPVALEPATRALNAAFPDGMRVLAAVEVAEGAPRLSRWLAASLWQLEYRPDAGAVLGEAVAALLAAERVAVARDRKGEITEVDLRPAVHGLAARGATVRALLHHVEPPMRPSEVHLALADHVSRIHPSTHGLAPPVLVTRLAQGAPAADGLREAISGEHLPLAVPASPPLPTKVASA